MRAFVGFIWEEVIDKPAQWKSELSKIQLAGWIQKTYINDGFINARSQMFNNLSDIRKWKLQVKNKNLIVAIDDFLNHVKCLADKKEDTCFIDNQPHDL